MSVTRGLTASQARKLLQLAKEADEICNVKSFDKDVRSEPGRAILIRVVNEEMAEIKPFKHRKSELVNLSSLLFWKGGCKFDIEEAINMIESPASHRHQTHGSRILSEPFVVLSRKFGQVWGGEQRRWTSNIATAQTWFEKSQTERVIEKLRKSPATDDVEAVERPVAFEFLAQKKKDSASVVMTTPAIIAEISNAYKNPPVQSSSDTEDNDDELTAMLNLDPNALVKASEEVKKAHRDCQSAELILQEAKQRLEEAKTNYRNVLSQMGVSPSTGTVTKTKRAKQSSAGKPRGFLREAVNTVLFNHSRLDMRTIVDKVMAAAPATTEDSVKQCLYVLRSKGLVANDGDGHWNMTEDGRKTFRP